MVVDTSALIAVLWREPGFEAYAQALSKSGRSSVSAVSLLEAHMAMVGRKGIEAADDLSLLVHEAGPTTIAMPLTGSVTHA